MEAEDRMSRLTAFALALAVLPALALADIAGTATVIDGDTLEINGERIRLHCSGVSRHLSTNVTDGEIDLPPNFGPDGRLRV